MKQRNALRKFALVLLAAGLVAALTACAGSEPATTSPTTTTTTVGEDFKSTGVIESIGEDAWVIGGQTYKVDQNTILDSGLAVGVLAKVEYLVLADGGRLAREIETP